MTEHPGGGLRIIAVGLIEKEGPDGSPLFLVAQRKKDAHLGGQIELPGGRVEPGESADAALRRELAEELGLEVTAMDRLTPITFAWHAYPERTVLLLFHGLRWHADMGEPAPLASDGLTWLDRDAFVATPMPPANRLLIDAVAAGWSAPHRPSPT